MVDPVSANKDVWVDDSVAISGIDDCNTLNMHKYKYQRETRNGGR